jgi:hypothetical protein
MDKYEAHKIKDAISSAAWLIFAAIMFHSCTQHPTHQRRIADALDRAYPPPAKQETK